MTTLVDLVATRLGAAVPQLGAVEYIADLAALIEAGALPQRDAGAFVIPLGIDGKGGQAATGMYTQMVSESVGVVVYVKARGDAKARSAVPAIDMLSDLVLAAIVGWAPEESVGVFEIIRGRLLSAEGGLVLYQLDFALLDQLRIAS